MNADEKRQFDSRRGSSPGNPKLKFRAYSGPMSEPFITRPLSIALDAVRFASAFLVLAGHTGGGSPVYNGPWSFSERLSHYSVIVFFVLSGLVISASVADRQTSLKAYAISRITRILPVAAVAVGFSMLIYSMKLAEAGQIPADFAAHLAKSALLSLSFLSLSGFGGDLSWDVPYWSLCYEAWFYALFGAAFFLRGILRWAVLAGMLLLVGVPILLLLPVWLAGVWLNRAAWPRSVTLGRAPLLLLGCAVAMQLVTIWDMNVLFAVRDIVPFSLGMSEWLVSDYFTAIIVVVAIAALRPLAMQYSAWLERFAVPISYAAGFTFTLYLFHEPVLGLLHLAGFATSGNPAWLVLAIAMNLAICAGIAELVERRTPALRRAVTRLLATRPEGKAATI